MLKHLPKVTILVAVMAMAATALHGAVPNAMNYQGCLRNSVGDPITDIVEISFAIYNDQFTGDQLWSETHFNVPVEEGLFNVVLGTARGEIPDSAFAVEQAWLEIVVNGEPIVPRTPLTATPYSFASSSVKGDFSTEPGEITLEDAAKGGGFVQFRAHGTGNDVSMYMSDPADEGRLSLYDWQGGQPESMVELKANRDAGSSLRMRNSVEQVDLAALSGDPEVGGSFELWGPSAGVLTDPVIWMGTEYGTYNTGVFRMREPTDERNLLEISTHYESGAIIRMFNPQPEPPEGLALEILWDGIKFSSPCGERTDRWTTYGSCAHSVQDTNGETLMVTSEEGVYMKDDDSKALWDTYLTPTGFKMAAGAADGYVMTADGDGVGTWQPAATGSTPCGVSQGIEIAGDDTLYSGNITFIMGRTIDCPSSGYVLVMASFDGLIRHHLGAGSPRFMFGVTDTPGVLDSDQRKEWYIEDYTMEPGHHGCVIATQKVFPVTAGIKTFYLAGYRSATTGCTDSCWIDNKTLSLVFIPESYGTVETAAMTGQEPLYTDDAVEIPEHAVSVVSAGTRKSGGEVARIGQLESRVEELTAIVNELREKQR